MSTNLAAWLRERPMVYAHRGFSAAAPMNTLAAFELAADVGADGIELDVQLSSDGHAVVIHDFTVDASTNGRGPVSELSLPQLKALDAGSWFGAEWCGAAIPTLAEVFEAVGRRLLVNVEIKTLPHQDDGIEEVVARDICNAGMEDRVLVSSFNPVALQRFRAILPQIPLARLTFSGMPAELIDMWHSVPCEVLHPAQDEVDEAFMLASRAGGYLVNTWTVNDETRARELRSLGVDGIVSDHPDRMLTCLK
ncbi:MAG: glycerophosphodiester phosphodiesterase [Anaerolineae bacterium]|nr:glycerophosphodiester phosphodiesterase [Anaerolineae bacterium]